MQLNSMADKATAHDVEVGEELYHRYQGLLDDLAELYDASPIATIGAFAVLSPRMSIEANFRSLVSCLDGVKAGREIEEINAGTFHKSRSAAVRILRGEVEFGDIVKGPKVTAFRHNIAFPDDSDRATIDGHMIGIMTGKPDLTMIEALFELRKVYGNGDPGYKRAETAFRRWVKRTQPFDGRPAHWVQAILWHAKRRLQSSELELGWSMPPADRIRGFNT